MPNGSEPSAEHDDDSGWCHGDVSNSSGTQAVFDYQVTNTRPDKDDVGELVSGTSVWVNVANPVFAAGDQAQAVVLVLEYAGACGQSCEQYAEVVDTYTIDLSYQNGRLTGSLPDLPIFSIPQDTDGSDTTAFYWQLAVVDNGTWYKADDGNNFKLAPNDSDNNYCVQGHSL